MWWFWLFLNVNGEKLRFENRKFIRVVKWAQNLIVLVVKFQAPLQNQIVSIAKSYERLR